MTHDLPGQTERRLVIYEILSDRARRAEKWFVTDRPSLFVTAQRWKNSTLRYWSNFTHGLDKPDPGPRCAACRWTVVWSRPGTRIGQLARMRLNDTALSKSNR